MCEMKQFYIFFNTYIEQASLSPLAFGPKSSYTTIDLPKILFFPLKGKLDKVKSFRLKNFSFLPPEIVSIPTLLYKSPVRQAV